MESCHSEQSLREREGEQREKGDLFKQENGMLRRDLFVSRNVLTLG